MRGRLTPLLLILNCLALTGAGSAPYVTPSEFNLQAILGDPPADNSPEHREEVNRMLDLQAARTPEQESRCRDEVSVTAFSFAPVLGPWFNAKDLPFTARLMAEANVEGKAVTDAAKLKWARVRPPLAEPRIKPCVPLEHTGSYPSGHAMRGILWATLLSEMFPDHRDALMAFGKQIGDDRFLAGMHYPSDVAAGQKLGAEIAKRLLSSDAFRQNLAKAKAECVGRIKKAA